MSNEIQKVSDSGNTAMVIAMLEFALLNVIAASTNLQVLWILMTLNGYSVGLFLSGLVKDGKFTSPILGTIATLSIFITGPIRWLTLAYALFTWFASVPV